MPSATQTSADDRTSDVAQALISHNRTPSDLSATTTPSRTPSPRPDGQSRKRALSIAVRYDRLQREHPEEDWIRLGGTYADVDILRSLLKKGYGYQDSDITVMKDDDPNFPPTCENILSEMRKLVKGAQSGDHYVFHFSGHGSQLPSEDHDAIWPADVICSSEVTSNYIRSDVSFVDYGARIALNIFQVIHNTLLKDFPSDAHLMIIFDCCHSASVADLPLDIEERMRQDIRSDAAPVLEGEVIPTKLQKHIRLRGTSFKPNVTDDDNDQQFHEVKKDEKYTLPHDHHGVLSLSACGDDELTPDTSNGGLFMKVLKRVLEDHNYHIPIEDLLLEVTDEMVRIIEDHNEKVKKRGDPGQYQCAPSIPHMGCEDEPVKVVHENFEM
ncbi:hypothetical protein WOLCODRAFT_155908 [Wolfiporia cocos MD-104 SS10]|uniref:Peptidase C14 caspase domain-containing protein n=1 Tax=Wolfiporia cocos (strain MD-104) TaxID=742152 RepID=A0A2H3J636_WOLCO|nr:hypothetical protein WOLCODRAFT_155908 [Wolfiporia cocos MD-104 SS10]